MGRHKVLFLEAEDEWGERLRARTLFGSDWYMTRKEALSEREVSIRLRVALGPVFERIAVENPRAWLGPALDASGAIG